MKNGLIIILMMCSFLSKAQQNISDNSKQTLASKYSIKVLAAYQENSKSKIEDLFNYFQMLTDASLHDDLKNEVVTNINLLYRNKNAMITDFTSESFDKISLQQFIQKLLISEPINFKVSEEAIYDSVTFDSWKSEYIITITKSGITSKIKVNQKVFMYDSEKEFGSKIKTVTSVLLDEMQ